MFKVSRMMNLIWMTKTLYTRECFVYRADIRWPILFDSRERRWPPQPQRLIFSQKYKLPDFFFLPVHSKRRRHSYPIPEQLSRLFEIFVLSLFSLFYPFLFSSLIIQSDWTGHTLHHHRKRWDSQLVRFHPKFP